LKNIITSLLLVVSISTFAQTGIGTTTPNSSAQLEVASTTKGFLPPRVALTGSTSASPLAAHVAGMVVYNTATVSDVTPGLYVNNGAAWTLATSSGGGTTQYSVGDFAQGGIVFWVDATGEHGLVCAKVDQSTVGMRWYAGTNGITQAKGDGIYAGKANTKIIISAQVAIGDDNATYAARMCNELQITESGITYADWYLPSSFELNLMYTNKSTINTTATANGGLSLKTDYYWSSTEGDSSNTWGQEFTSSVMSSYAKTNYSNVRAVRAF
jgi:hypothetical protein